MSQDPTQDNSASRQASNLAAWHVVRKYWPTALATALLVTAAVTFFTLGQKKIYEAQATIQFDPNPPRPLGRRVETVVDMGSNTYWNNQEYYETQYNIIQSMRVAMAVVSDLGLNHDGAFLNNLASGDAPIKQKVDPEVAAMTLRSRLTVSPVRDSRLAIVKLRDADPARAQRLLSALVDAYVAQNLDIALQSTNQANDWLRSQLDKLKSDLESSEMALYEYKAEKDILSVAFDDQSNMIREEMKHINAELTSARAEQQQVSARKVVLDQVPTRDPSKIYSSELLNDSLLNGLRQRYEGSVAEREALIGSGLGLKHPDVVAATKRVEQDEKGILQEIKNVKMSVSNDLAVINHRVGGLSGLLTDAKKRALDLNLLEIEHNRLQRSKDNTEKLYSLVLERTKESDLTRMLRVNNIQVLDRPLLPRLAVSPRVSLNITIGLIVGLLLGVAASFIRALLDRTVKVPDDIEQDLGATFIGILPMYGTGQDQPYQKKRRRGRVIQDSGKPELIVHDQPTSSAAEAARAIRTNLIFMAPDNPYKVLLVTSGGPREGKTTVTSSIAIAMAQANQRVLLLDCDLRRPRIHRVFGCRSDTGVTTALIHAEYDAAIRDSEVPNLSIMPCGPVPPNPAELFHSDRFKKMLSHLREKFDRIIIDSPPVVAVTDAAILSTLVDGTVLVARAYSTRKELARHAVRAIRDVGGNLAGAVLNAVDFSRLEYKYSSSYYYHYRRSSYYGLDSSETDDDQRGESPAQQAS